MQMSAYFFSVYPQKIARGEFFVTSAKLHILESPLRFWEKGWKGKKIKSRKFIPFFPHLTTTSMQEHTHMTPDNTRDKRGLTKDLVIWHIILPLGHDQAKLFGVFCWISIRKSRLNIYCVKLGRRWRGSIFCVYPFFF